MTYILGRENQNDFNSCEKKSSRVWLLTGFYFCLHPLRFGERGAEITCDVLIIHYCYKRIVGGRQNEGYVANECVVLLYADVSMAILLS